MTPYKITPSLQLLQSHKTLRSHISCSSISLLMFLHERLHLQSAMARPYTNHPTHSNTQSPTKGKSFCIVCFVMYWNWGRACLVMKEEVFCCKYVELLCLFRCRYCFVMDQYMWWSFPFSMPNWHGLEFLNTHANLNWNFHLTWLDAPAEENMLAMDDFSACEN